MVRYQAFCVPIYEDSGYMFVCPITFIYLIHVRDFMRGLCIYIKYIIVIFISSDVFASAFFYISVSSFVRISVVN